GAFENGRCLELFQRGPWFSLSLRERAGVRGNGPWKLQTAGVLRLALGFRISDFIITRTPASLSSSRPTALLSRHPPTRDLEPWPEPGLQETAQVRQMDYRCHGLHLLG